MDLMNFNTEQEAKTQEYYEKTPVKIKGCLAAVNFPRSGVMEDFGFSIVKLNLHQVLEGELHPRAKNARGLISVKGVMARIEAGDVSEFTLKLLEVSDRWGATYRPIYKKNDYKFDTIEQQKIFFESFLTEKQTENIFETFSNPIEILKNGDVQSLCDVKGIGESTAEKILDRYESSKDFAEAFVELAEYDLTANAIINLSKMYGSPDTLIKIIKENPYVLVEAEGYGFKKADNIALQGGLDRNSCDRAIAFIQHILKEKGQQGYSWIESSELIHEIEDSLDDMEMDTVIEAVNKLKEKGRVWNEEFGKVGVMGLYRLENKIADELFRLMDAPKMEIPEGWEDRIKQAEKLQGWEYTDEQVDAIKTILDNNVCIVTGYGGSGKTGTVLGALKALGNTSFGMCALSGKASSVLQDATGYKSHTIHRILGFNEGVFGHNKDFPMLYNVVILDEASMVNGELFLSLIQAVKTGSKLIMIGDTNQIPPIGSLNVFHDCLESDIIPSVRLTKIHRQAQASAIITNSIKVSKGEQLVQKGYEGKETRGELQDLHLDIYSHSWKTFDKIIETFKEKLEVMKDYNKISVIVPYNLRGEVCVYNVNNKLQEIVNPPSPEKAEVEVTYEKDKKGILRKGDLIMNLKNNYKIEAIIEEGNGTEKISIFNGFIGELKEIYYNGNLEVYFPILEKRVIIPKSHWEKGGIQLGYTMSVHKAQGSQNECIIIGMDYTHYKMLTSELLYTAITRASKDCTLITTRQALNQAIKTKDSTAKQTFLPELLKRKIN